jgi:hypothetical protein
MAFAQIIILYQVAEGYPPNMKRALLLHFLNLFQSKQLGHDHLVVVMQMLILPMLAHAFQNAQSWEVVDPGIIKTIVDKLLDPPEEVLPWKFHFSFIYLMHFVCHCAFCRCINLFLNESTIVSKYSVGALIYSLIW